MSHRHQLSGQGRCKWIFFAVQQVPLLSSVPDGLRKDNVSNLVSEDMESYVEEMGVAHHHSKPFWGRANGEV